MPSNAVLWRAGIFFGLIAILIVWELASPRRRLSQPRRLRWVSNFGIFLVDSVLTRGLILAGGLAAAAFAAKMGWGVMNWMSVPSWVAILLTLLLLDFAVWAQHVASHRWHWFWRLHRVHHSDLDIDVTTALRFHPAEILVSLVYKSVVIMALGAPLAAVFIFEIVLNSCAMFNHSNIKLPRWLDRIIRLVLVTPDMHRVHHSTRKQEHTHNYGFCLSIWDRLFRLYTAQPQDGHQGMSIGLPEFRGEGEQTFAKMLVMPLK